VEYNTNGAWGDGSGYLVAVEDGALELRQRQGDRLLKRLLRGPGARRPNPTHQEPSSWTPPPITTTYKQPVVYRVMT